MLHVENHGAIRVPCFQGQEEVPLLRKVVVTLDSIRDENCSGVVGLLNYLSHVEKLSLRIKDSEQEMYPFPILWGQDEEPSFPNLKHLDVTMCFYDYNFEDVVFMLHHCPALESVGLVHEFPKFTGWANQRTRRDWKSKLPQNADLNYQYVYFSNLHLGKKRKNVLKAPSKKCTANRLAPKADVFC